LGSYEIVVPGVVSAIRTVPLNLKPREIEEVSGATFKCDSEIIKMKKVCSSAARVLKFASDLIQVNSFF